MLCRPPPKGSPLHQRLVSMGRAAAAYGKFSTARECWEAAGEWGELLPLCALQGDFVALRGYSSQQPDTKVGCGCVARQQPVLALLHRVRFSLPCRANAGH